MLQLERMVYRKRPHVGIQEMVFMGSIRRTGRQKRRTESLQRARMKKFPANRVTVPDIFPNEWTAICRNMMGKWLLVLLLGSERIVSCPVLDA